MSEKNEHNAKELDLTELFTEDFAQAPSADDLFAGEIDLDFLTEKGKKNKKHSKGVLTGAVVAVMIVNMIIFGGAGVWAYYNLPDLLSKAARQTPPVVVVKNDTNEPIENVAKTSEQITEEVVFDGPVSFSMAEGLFNEQKYQQAYAAYEKVKGNLTSNIPSERYLSDYLDLKMGLALMRYNPQADTRRHFENAQTSLSPFVKALTNYHLAFIHIKAGRFMQARQCGYRALAITECFREYADANFETDCYFIISEALTREVLAINNRDTSLPASGWTGDLRFQTIIPQDQQQLQMILEAGIDEISKGSLIPEVSSKEHENVGIKYSARAVNSPVKEILQRTASVSGQNILWQGQSSGKGWNEVTINATNSTSQFIVEVSAGASGLIARFDDPDVLVYDPKKYTSLEEHKQLLVGEAIALWRRFLMRYRGDHRSANASYARALMLECTGHVDSAINHYLRTANNFVHNHLAPYCLLNSAKLRVKMMDYVGAEQDLTQLVMEYSDSSIANDAYLELAVTAMSSGHYENAIKSFKRLYNTDISDGIRAKSAKGAGMCFLNLKDFENADKWLSLCVGFEDRVDMDYAPVYFSLGKAKVETGDYDQAAIALKNSLIGDLPAEEIVNILIHLAVVQTKQGNFVKAMDTVESIDTENLSQEMVVETLLTKSYILRQSQLPENAIPIIRQRLAYLADNVLRSRMCFELAKCYMTRGDYQGARDELINALEDIAPGQLANDISFELAGVYYVLGDDGRCVELCNMLLNKEIETKTKTNVYRLLGDSYTRMEKFDMAAMAYAGRIGQRGIPKI